MFTSTEVALYRHLKAEREATEKDTIFSPSRSSRSSSPSSPQQKQSQSSTARGGRNAVSLLGVPGHGDRRGKSPAGLSASRRSMHLQQYSASRLRQQNASNNHRTGSPSSPSSSSSRRRGTSPSSNALASMMSTSSSSGSGGGGGFSSSSSSVKTRHFYGQTRDRDYSSHKQHWSVTARKMTSEEDRRKFRDAFLLRLEARKSDEKEDYEYKKKRFGRIWGIFSVFLGYVRSKMTAFRLTAAERAWAFNHYTNFGEIKTYSDAAILLSNMGVFAGAKDVAEVMEHVLGHLEGKLLSFTRFLMLCKYFKIRFIEHKRTPTALVAFVSLGGDENDPDSAVTADKLRETCDDFKLTANVDQFIKAVDTSGDGDLQYDEFCMFLGPEASEPGGADKEADPAINKWNPFEELKHPEKLLEVEEDAPWESMPGDGELSGDGESDEQGGAGGSVVGGITTVSNNGDNNNNNNLLLQKQQQQQQQDSNDENEEDQFGETRDFFQLPGGKAAITKKQQQAEQGCGQSQMYSTPSYYQPTSTSSLGGSQQQQASGAFAYSSGVGSVSGGGGNMMVGGARSFNPASSQQSAQPQQSQGVSFVMREQSTLSGGGGGSRSHHHHHHHQSSTMNHDIELDMLGDEDLTPEMIFKGAQKWMAKHEELEEKMHRDLYVDRLIKEQDNSPQPMHFYQPHDQRQRSLQRAGGSNSNNNNNSNNLGSGNNLLDSPQNTKIPAPPSSSSQASGGGGRRGSKTLYDASSANNNNNNYDDEMFGVSQRDREREFWDKYDRNRIARQHERDTRYYRPWARESARNKRPPSDGTGRGGSGSGITPDQRPATSSLAESGFGTAPRFSGESALTPLPKAGKDPNTQVVSHSARTRTHFRQGAPTVGAVQQHLRKLGSSQSARGGGSASGAAERHATPQGVGAAGEFDGNNNNNNNNNASAAGSRPVSSSNSPGLSGTGGGRKKPKWFEQDPFAPPQAAPSTAPSPPTSRFPAIKQK